VCTGITRGGFCWSPHSKGLEPPRAALGLLDQPNWTTARRPEADETVVTRLEMKAAAGEVYRSVPASKVPRRVSLAGPKEDFAT
jgi:hypothetical protein